MEHYRYFKCEDNFNIKERGFVDHLMQIYVLIIKNSAALYVYNMAVYRCK